MSDKPTESHSEVVAMPQKGGFKRHCARFWWIYLIAFIIIAVLAVVLMCANRSFHMREIWSNNEAVFS
jgi:hypothetical protein